MKYFIPVSDEALFSDTEMQRYRLVPYNPDFVHLPSVPKPLEKPRARRRDERNRHDPV